MTIPSAPALCAPLVVRQGDGPAFLVGGQVVRVLADTVQTAGAFGLMHCEAPRDPMAIPLHWHAREHDTWFCTRGRITVWGSGQARTLHPGDFAYVPPGEVHAYQCTGTSNAFFGLVAPGGWEAFFGDAGVAWTLPGVPPPGSEPFDIGRLVAAQAKHGVIRTEQQHYAAVTEQADDVLPAGSQTYFLQAGFGARAVLWGALFTRIIGPEQNGGLFAMHVVEASAGVRLPPRLQVATLEAVHVLAGAVAWVIDGTEHLLHQGDTAILPAGTHQSSRIASGAARWISCSAGAGVAAFIAEAGQPAQGFGTPLRPAPADPAALRELAARHAITLEA